MRRMAVRMTILAGLCLVAAACGRKGPLEPPTSLAPTPTVSAATV